MVAEFVARWVQSPSGYDFLVASTVPVDWARSHMPVISTAGQHHTYVRFRFEEPWGKFIVCPKGHRGDFKISSRATSWRVICRGCGARSNVPRVELDSQQPLGRKAFVKTEFPVKQHVVAWQLGPTTDGEDPPPLLPQPCPALAASFKPAPSPSTSVTVAPVEEQTPAAPVRSRATGEMPRTTSLPVPSGSGVGPLSSGSSKLKIRVPPRAVVSTIPRARSTPSLADHSSLQLQKGDARDSGSARKKQKRG